MTIREDRCFLPGCPRKAVEIVNNLSCCAYHAVLRRARWQCEAIVDDRMHPGKQLRCLVMGSEIGVSNGEARCPAHRESEEPRAQQLVVLVKVSAVAGRLAIGAKYELKHSPQTPREDAVARTFRAFKRDHVDEDPGGWEVQGG